MAREILIPGVGILIEDTDTEWLNPGHGIFNADQAPAAPGGRIMGSIAGKGGLAGHGGIAGQGGGIAG